MKIILLCGAGLSTSLLAKKMQAEAVKQNKDITVEAIAYSDADDSLEEADLYLLGPQIEYYLDRLKEMVPDRPCAVVDMTIYGLMDGKRALAFALKEMERWNA